MKLEWLSVTDSLDLWHVWLWDAERERSVQIEEPIAMHYAGTTATDSVRVAGNSLVIKERVADVETQGMPDAAVHRRTRRVSVQRGRLIRDDGLGG